MSRKQRVENAFTYVSEPGEAREVSLNGGQYSVVDRYGSINLFTEPVVVANYKPLEVIGGVKVYNQRTNQYEMRSVKVKTSFDNETIFFANDQINRYFETIEETDDNYERLKELYLDGGLDDDSSPLEMFNLLTYKQTIWPKQQYSYLNKTRGRTFFINKFWRDVRTDRTETNIDNGFAITVPSQSMWPLDVAADWATRGIPSQSVNGSDSIYGYYIGGTLGYNKALLGNLYGFNTGDDLAAVMAIPRASSS